MPRLPRTVFARLPHHVTQRGNRREPVFSDGDRQVYLSWLKEYTDKHQVEVLAYCLVTNHIHLIAVPATDDGLMREEKGEEKGDATLFGERGKAVVGRVLPAVMGLRRAEPDLRVRCG